MPQLDWNSHLRWARAIQDPTADNTRLDPSLCWAIDQTILFPNVHQIRLEVLKELHDIIDDFHVLVCVRRSRNNSHNADGKCQALPSMVFLVRVDGWSGVICVKLSGSPIKRSRCRGVTGCELPWCGLVRNWGWYRHCGNCLLSCCHLSQVESSAWECFGGGQPRSVGACVVRQ